VANPVTPIVPGSGATPPAAAPPQRGRRVGPSPTSTEKAMMAEMALRLMPVALSIRAKISGGHPAA
jgi:hypothetical protein